MTTNRPTTAWWVEPNYMPGVHKIRASVCYMSGRTIEVSHLLSQYQLDSATVPHWFIGRVIFKIQSDIMGATK